MELGITTNCESKQEKWVLVRWFKCLFEGYWGWRTLFPNESVCTATLYLGDKKFERYREWLQRVTAFFVHSGATIEQARMYFAGKIRQNWWHSCRSNLMGILTVSKNAADKIEDGGDNFRLTPSAMAYLVPHHEDMAKILEIKNLQRKNLKNKLLAQAVKKMMQEAIEEGELTEAA